MRGSSVGGWVVTVCCLVSLQMAGPVHGQRRLFQGLRDRINNARGESQPKLAFAAMEPDTSEPLDNKAVQSLVAPLAAAIKARPDQTKPFRIAVFPFGDVQKGVVTEDNLGDVVEVQGVLTAALRRELSQLTPQSFALLDAFALKRLFAEGGVDPTSIGPGNPDLQNLLQQLEIDAAVVGTATNRRFEASVVVSHTQHKPPTVKAFVGVRDNSAPYSNLDTERFNVSMYCDAAALESRTSQWRRNSLVTTNDGGPYHKKLYALIPQQFQHARFKIQIANNGFQPGKLEFYPSAIGNPDRERESQRIFGVVVTVDGINSFYEDDGEGNSVLLPLDPRTATKWLLAPPGYFIEPGRGGQAQLVAARGESDHSLLDIVGFQHDEKVAKAFTLAEVGTGQGIVAERLNMDKSIGLISVYFFAQKLPGDQNVHWQFPAGPARATGGQGQAAAGPPEPKATLGTAEGVAVAHPVVGVQVEFHNQPVHEVHILYRAEAACPIPPGQRLVLQR